MTQTSPDASSDAKALRLGGRRWWPRAGWLLLTIGGGVVAGAAAPLLFAQHDDGVAALRASADRLRARVERGIDQRSRTLESRAAEAAGLPELISGLELRADAHTFEDLLQTEDWWAPYRNDLALSGLVVDSGEPVILGPALDDLPRSDLVRRARDDGASWSIAVTSDRVLLLAAARVARRTGRASRAVVVVGVEIDGKMLDAWSDEPSWAVGLSDGTRLGAAGGAQAGRAALTELATTRPGGGLGRVHPSSSWAGVVWPLERGMSLLAVVAVPAPHPFGLPIAHTASALGAGATLVLVGLAILLARRRGAQASPPPIAGAAGAQPTDSWRMPFEGSSGTPDGSSPSTAALSPPPVDAPKEMGRYHLLERIGEGGMAEIYVAETRGSEGFIRNFVVKRLHPHLAHNREATNQFIDEARLQSRLVHSNIVPVFDFGVAGGEYYIAMEHIRGCDLDHLVQRHKDAFGRALGLPVAYYIVQSVLDALAYAHSAVDDRGRSLDIVHRDVAPGNVLISYRGEVKLSDFGIAKAERRVTRTDAGVVKGNASYMSPEQARGDRVDARSDLFSTGGVLYYCLSGQLMYDDDDGAMRRLMRAAAGPTTPELIEIDKVPPVAAAVLRRALAADAAQRYQTARELAADLSGYFTSGRAELADLMTQLFPESRRPPR